MSDATFDAFEGDCDLAVLKRHAAKLGEHFDTVQIFATRHDEGKDGGTIACDFGSGNWYARRGQVGDWMIRRDAETADEATRRDDGP